LQCLYTLLFQFEILLDQHFGSGWSVRTKDNGKNDFFYPPRALNQTMLMIDNQIRGESDNLSGPLGKS